MHQKLLDLILDNFDLNESQANSLARFSISKYPEYTPEQHIEFLIATQKHSADGAVQDMIVVRSITNSLESRFELLGGTKLINVVLIIQDLDDSTKYKVLIGIKEGDELEQAVFCTIPVANNYGLEWNNNLDNPLIFDNFQNIVKACRKIINDYKLEADLLSAKKGDINIL